MNTILNTKFTVIFFIYLSVSLKAQLDLKFISHLKSNSLVKEHIAFLNQQKEKPLVNFDSLNFLLQDFYLTQKNNDSLYNYLKLNSQIALKDTIVNCELSKYWLSTLDNKHAIYWFDTLNTTTNCYCSKSIKEAFNRGFQLNSTTPLIMDPYFSSYKQLKKAYNKKPFVAGALSAILPGLGKWYIGKPKVFLLNLVAHVAYASQSYESIRKLGLKQNYTYFILGFGSIFYISNIYGSYNDAKIFRKEKRKIYLNDASSFYSNYFSFK